MGITAARAGGAGRETLGQKAYHALRARIVGGEFEPGARLSLRRLAKSLGMSLAPVGEAFRELARDGLIEMDPGWGARVRRWDYEAIRGQLILRTAIECEAARHAAARVTKDEVLELARLAKELDRAIDGRDRPSQVRELDSRFHIRVAQLAAVPSLLEALLANQLVRMLARGSVLAHAVPRPKRQHLELVAAIRTRDPERAERAMRGHCVRSMELQLGRMAVYPLGD